MSYRPTSTDGRHNGDNKINLATATHSGSEYNNIFFVHSIPFTLGLIPKALRAKYSFAISLWSERWVSGWFDLNLNEVLFIDFHEGFIVYKNTSPNESSSAHQCHSLMLNAFSNISILNLVIFHGNYVYLLHFCLFHRLLRLLFSIATTLQAFGWQYFPSQCWRGSR